MKAIINLYSVEKNEITKFLKEFYGTKNLKLKNKLKWEKEYDNPIEMADIIGTFIDNNDKYKINMWLSLDPGIFININDYNADKIIRYLYERYPY